MNLWRVLAAAVLAAATPCDLLPQAVQGQLVQQGTGVPIARAFVTLLDSQQVELARTLTDDQGRYLLRARGPGSYRLQSKRIGFRAAVSPPIALDRGQTVRHDLAAEALPLPLPAVLVEGRPQCGYCGEEGSAVTRLWEEIGEALAAVSWTARQPYRYELALFERDLDVFGRSVRRESVSRRAGSYQTPFRSASPEQLVRDGWVVFEGNRRLFYGPDVEAVRSAAFAQTHCFSLTAGRGADSNLVGLMFEPTRDRRVPDISGTLWIHRGTAELTRLDFSHVNLPRGANSPPDWNEGQLGGRVEFMPVPSGGWIVRSWEIRTPLVGWVELFAERRELRLVGIQQTGGQVVRTLSGGTVLYAADLATLTGSVFDETRSVPLAGAVVSLVGTPFATSTDAAGRFALSGTMEGEYGVTFSHPRLDSLAYTHAPITIPLRPGQSETVRLTVPPESVIVRQLCPADTVTGQPTRVLNGTVRDRRGNAALPDAQVRMAWQDILGLAPTDPIAVEGRLRELTPREMEAVAPVDSAGRYVMCGVPVGRRIVLAARRGDVVAEPVVLRFESGGVWLGERWVAAGLMWQHDLTVGTSLAPAILTAVVTDAMTGRPLPHAIVTLVGTGATAVTDDAGRATVTQVPAGSQVVTARRIGYQAVERVLRVTPGDTVRAGDLALEPMPVLLDTLIAAGTPEETDPILRLGGFYDRRRRGFGDFITRQQFEPHNPVDVFDVLRRLPHLEVLFNENYGRPAADRAVGRDTRRWIVRARRLQRDCPVLVFLDGAVVGTTERIDLDDLIGVHQIAAVEFFGGAAAIPPEFNMTGSDCGVLVLWTRR